MYTFMCCKYLNTHFWNCKLQGWYKRFDLLVPVRIPRADGQSYWKYFNPKPLSPWSMDGSLLWSHFYDSVFFCTTYHMHFHRPPLLWCTSTNTPSVIAHLSIQEIPFKKQTMRNNPFETGLQAIRTQAGRELVIYGLQIYGCAPPL